MSAKGVGLDETIVICVLVPADTFQVDTQRSAVEEQIRSKVLRIRGAYRRTQKLASVCVTLSDRMVLVEGNPYNTAAALEGR